MFAFSACDDDSKKLSHLFNDVIQNIIFAAKKLKQEK